MSVGRAAYDEHFTGDFRKQVGRHFTYAVRCAIGFTQEWRRENKISEATEFIFDSSDKAQRREIDGIFDGMLQDEYCFEHYGVKAGCHSFRDKTEIIPLQAADMLAYCIFQGDKERFGQPLSPIPVDTMNFFIRQKNFLTARYQTPDVVAAIGAGTPHLMYSEDRRPKPTPKGTRPKTSHRSV